MEPEDRRLLTDIHGIVSGLKPVIDTHGKTIDALDSRTRRLEIGHGAHEVKIGRLQDDLDGLGRKVRHVGAPRSETGMWRSILEIFASAPALWHFVLSACSIAVMAATILWKHWPR